MKNKKSATPIVDTAELLQVLDKRPLPASAKRIAPENRLPKFEVMNAAGAKKAAIHLLDAVSYWNGNDARTFQQRLAALDVDEIDLYINSPGGSVFEGVTIYNLLVAHPATVNVHVLGLAASISSVIMLAGDKVEIAENAMVMIHDPSAAVWGKAEQMRQVADVLDKITESIVNTYETRTKLTRDQLRAAMAAETYYTADEAVANGFADVKVTPMKAAAALWNPEDYEMPVEAKALAYGWKDEGEDEEGEDAGEDAGEGEEPEPSKPASPSAKAAGDGDAGAPPESVGSLEDVAAAENFLNSIRASLAADES